MLDHPKPKIVTVKVKHTRAEPETVKVMTVSKM
jgi:hypothetical protein